MSQIFFLNLLIYLFISLSLFSTWFLILRKFSSFNKVEKVAGSFLFSITQIISTELLLGVVVQRLYAFELLIFNLFLCLIFITVFRINIKFKLNNLRDKFKFDKHKLKSIFKRKNWVVIVISLLTLFVILNLLILIFAWGPTSWDDYHYHMGFVADIMQSGMIRNFDYPQLYTISFPHNIELLDLWNVIFFRNDGGVEITNLFFVIFSGIIIYLTCLKFKVSKRYSLLAALLVFYIPMNLLLVKTTKVDVDLAGLFMGAMYFLITIDFKDLGSRTNKFRIVLSSICVAIIFGSKSSGIDYVLAYAISLVALTIFSLKIKNIKSILKFLLLNGIVLFSACLLIGSFWYFRSWIIFGNPLYPLDFKILGMHFAGEWKNLDFAEGLPQIQGRNYFSRLLYVWREKESWFGTFYISDGKLAGFGSLWYIILMPSVLFAFIYGILKKQYKLLIYIVGVLISFAIIPGNWVPHYSTLITLLGAVTFIVFFYHNVKSIILKAGIGLLVFVLLILNTLLMLNGGYLDFKQTFKRITDPDANDFPHTMLFQNSNMIVNEILDDNDTVVIGSQTYFSYALYKDNFASKEIMVQYKDENNWLNSLKDINPRLVMTLQDTPEYNTAKSHPELFDQVLIEDTGPHYLYAYLGNKKNDAAKDKIIHEETHENDISKPAALKSLKVSEKYGVINIDIDFYINQPDIITTTPRIFTHIIKGNDYYNLDFNPQKNTSEEIEGTTQLSPLYGNNYQIQVGLYDKNVYIPLTVDVNE